MFLRRLSGSLFPLVQFCCLQSCRKKSLEISDPTTTEQSWRCCCRRFLWHILKTSVAEKESAYQLSRLFDLFCEISKTSQNPRSTTTSPKFLAWPIFKNGVRLKISQRNHWIVLQKWGHGGHCWLFAKPSLGLSKKENQSTTLTIEKLCEEWVFHIFFRWPKRCINDLQKLFMVFASYFTNRPPVGLLMGFLRVYGSSRGPKDEANPSSRRGSEWQDIDRHLSQQKKHICDQATSSICSFLVF